MASIRLRWALLPDAEVQNFKIHRSIIGFQTEGEAPFGLVPGDTLVLRVNSENSQEIEFDGDYEPEDLVTFLDDKLEGASVYKSFYDDTIYVRSDLRSSPGFIQIVGGSALSKMGIEPRTISEKSETHPIGFLDGLMTQFEDEDGVIEDFYGISTIDGLGNESTVTSLRQSVGMSGPICVIEGKVLNLQGQRVPDVKVSAKIVTRPQTTDGHSAITKDKVHVLTGEDGRFSLPLLQKAQVIFEIDDTRISDPIEVPEASFVYFDDLPIYENYRFIDQ